MLCSKLDYTNLGWHLMGTLQLWCTLDYDDLGWALTSVILVNENENDNGEKRENNEFVNEN